MSHKVIEKDAIATEAGSTVKTLLSGKDHDIQFTHVYLEPGSSSPDEDFVIHPNSGQIEYILFGTGKAVYPDETYHLRPGVGVYHSAGQPHRFENDSDEPLIFVVATAVGDEEGAKRVPYQQNDDSDVDS